MEEYELADAAKAIYNFVWDEFCDWFVEISKPALQRDEESDWRLATGDWRWLYWQALVTVLETSLRLLHPFMPFVTEELWQRLIAYRSPVPDPQSLMVAKYPEADERFFDDEAERQMAILMELVRKVRAIRADLGIPTAKVDIVLARYVEGVPQLVRENLWWLKFVGRITNVQFTEDEQIPNAVGEPVQTFKTIPAEDGTPTTVAEGLTIAAKDKTPTLTVTEELTLTDSVSITVTKTWCTVFVPLSGIVDISKLKERWQKRLNELTKELERVEGRLSNPQFVERAPAEVVAAERQRLAELRQQRETLERRLKSLGTTGD
jgi:valyl-tRNA synthetase